MRITALVKRIFQQMLRDKRTLGLLFVAPLLILTLMHFLFNGNTVNPKLGAINIDKSLISDLEKVNIDIKKYDGISKDIIDRDKLDGLLEMKNDKLQLTLENSQPTVSRVIEAKVNQVVISQNMQRHFATLQSQMKQFGNRTTLPNNVQKDNAQDNINVIYVYGNEDTNFFDILNPVLIGFFVFFFVFIISGIGLLRERTTGTLERLLATPIQRAEIVLGYLIGYGAFAVIQTIIVVLFSINVLSVVLVGSIWSVITINLILALVALSLGTLLSAFAASEFQMMQFIPIIIVPQIFFAGIFPTENMATWLQSVAKIMPIYYAADALKSVMYKGFDLSQVSGDICALSIFAVIFIILNVFALKKYRKI
ncbi:ABC transporter permease [Clostridium sp. BNL1100]|uniref:ABC transporter permease n=1 Tax=Clostridium sp. BNL1100 TaxID=755731 RepID=UPI00024A7941|nr:ABC transporter permease [Clostridium sp. BNL1100]AEY66118.1 ABC-type multidrug transport system, permease component [Clostridium sp. BNL1100]